MHRWAHNIGVCVVHVGMHVVHVGMCSTCRHACSTSINDVLTTFSTHVLGSVSVTVSYSQCFEGLVG